MTPNQEQVERLPFRIEVSPNVDPDHIYIFDPAAVPFLVQPEDDLRRQIWCSSNEQAEKITDALRRAARVDLKTEAPAEVLNRIQAALHPKAEP